MLNMGDVETMAELVEPSGIPAADHIARGLLAGPVKAGRGVVFTDDHLERLERIKSCRTKAAPLPASHRQHRPMTFKPVVPAGIGSTIMPAGVCAPAAAMRAARSRRRAKRQGFGSPRLPFCIHSTRCG
jgi:hypothetical protein